MTGEEEQPEEFVQVANNFTNTFTGKVIGTVIQIDAVHGIVVRQPKDDERPD